MKRALCSRCYKPPIGAIWVGDRVYCDTNRGWVETCYDEACARDLVPQSFRDERANRLLGRPVASRRR